MSWLLLLLLLLSLSGPALSQKGHSNAKHNAAVEKNAEMLAMKLSNEDPVARYGYPDDSLPLRNLEIDLLAQVNFHVTVVLVGFDTTGREKIRVDKSELLRYLRKIRATETIHALYGESHDLESGLGLTFTVVDGAPNMLANIERGLKPYLEVEAASDGIEVPFDVIDNVINVEHRKNALSYGIYLINTPTIGKGHPYRYGSKASNQSNLHRKECGTAMWVGTNEERYVWVDLSAGPINFGPSSEGEGVVTAAAFPRVENFKTATAFSHKGFLADLAAFTSKICEHVFLPPVKWLPLVDAPVLFTIVHVSKENGKTPLPFDWNKIQEIVKETHYNGMPVSFSEFRLTSTQWYTAALAYKNAERQTGGFDIPLTRSIDPEELHHHLSKSTLFESITSAPERVIPIFVFDLDFSVPMKTQPAVAFQDMVILVNADHTSYFAKFMCQGKLLSDNYVNHPQDTTRFVLGALMETTWGIAPSYQTWSSVRNAISEDYTFATGFSPFGPFGVSLRLSFVLKDAAIRFLVLQYKNETTTELRDFLHRFQAVGPEVRDIFVKEDLNTLHYSWSYFQEKYQRGVTAISFHSLQWALALFRSLSKEDIAEIRSLFNKASLQLITDIHCPEITMQDASPSLPTRVLEMVLTLSLVYSLAVLFKRYDVGGMFASKKNK